MRKYIVWMFLGAAVLYTAHELFYQSSFVDDAFISFRYAHNFSEGFGLRFNPSALPVEGYTNFLWTLIIALLHFVPVPLFFTLRIVTFSLYILILLLTYRLARDLGLDNRTRTVLVLLVALNPSIRFAVSSGLETIFVLLQIVLVSILLLSKDEEKGKTRMFPLAGGFCASLLLTRIDTILLFVSFIVIALIRKRMALKQQLMIHLVWIIPLLALIVLSVFRYLYYSSLVPNTFYVKAVSGTSFLYGIVYVYIFMFTYLFPLSIPLILKPLIKIVRSSTAVIAFALTICLWVMYVVYIGGDYIEFRFLVPIIPFVYCLFFIAYENLQNRYWRVVVILLLFIGTVVQPVFFFHIPERQKQKIGTDFELEQLTREFSYIGRGLKHLFGNSDITIAVTAAGAIPYYSQLKTIDMLGLNDAYVAKHGIRFSTMPGHQRMAQIQYLQDQHVHIILYYPSLVSKDEYMFQRYQEWSRYFTFQSFETQRDREVLIRIGTGQYVFAYYLTDHPAVDELIAKGAIVQIDKVLHH